ARCAAAPRWVDGRLRPPAATRRQRWVKQNGVSNRARASVAGRCCSRQPRRRARSGSPLRLSSCSPTRAARCSATSLLRSIHPGRPSAVLRPATTADVAEAVRLCAEQGVPIVPQGGNTSMVGGAAVSEDGSEIVLSLSRMNKVRAIDPVDMTMEIEAGVTLKAAQDVAADADCLLPLSISSEGSAQIGGVLATNAGGNNTVRYGNARDLVLGL